MLKAYLSCPKATQYKYAERLKSRRMSSREIPLHRGTWIHELLQAHYEGKDWKEVHALNTKRFNLLMDEERDELGDLPTECARIMRSYLWHYGANKEDPMHGWDVLGAEVTLEAVWPDSEDGLDIYRCRVDLLVEDEYGLLIVDHKTHKTLPGHTFRVLDAASPLYIWAARESGYDVRGFLWNYLRTKAPTSPKMVYVGKPNERLSESAIDTDWPTYAGAIKAYGLDHTAEPYASKLRSLKAQRWKPGMPETSPFFQRSILEKDDDMIARVVATSMRTRDRMHDDFDDFEVTERNMGRPCDWCRFKNLCTTEMYGGDGQSVRRKEFRKGDPLDYYHDKREVSDNG
jgi:hypothetical protein